MEKTEKRVQNKGGRPTLGARKKTRQVKFNADERQYETLVEKAAATGMALPEYVREVSLNGYVKAIHTSEAKGQRVDFIRLSNNLNQLARQAHLQGLKPLVAQFDGLIAEINEILKKYKA